MGIHDFIRFYMLDSMPVYIHEGAIVAVEYENMGQSKIIMANGREFVVKGEPAEIMGMIEKARER